MMVVRNTYSSSTFIISLMILRTSKMTSSAYYSSVVRYLSSTIIIHLTILRTAQVCSLHGPESGHFVSLKCPSGSRMSLNVPHGFLNGPLATRDIEGHSGSRGTFESMPKLLKVMLCLRISLNVLFFAGFRTSPVYCYSKFFTRFKNKQ